MPSVLLSWIKIEAGGEGFREPWCTDKEGGMEEITNLTLGKVGEEGLQQVTLTVSRTIVWHCELCKGTQKKHGGTHIHVHPEYVLSHQQLDLMDRPSHHVYDNDEHVWLHAASLVGEYTQTHACL